MRNRGPCIRSHGRGLMSLPIGVDPTSTLIGRLLHERLLVGPIPLGDHRLVTKARIVRTPHVYQDDRNMMIGSGRVHAQWRSCGHDDPAGLVSSPWSAIDRDADRDSPTPSAPRCKLHARPAAPVPDASRLAMSCRVRCRQCFGSRSTSALSTNRIGGSRGPRVLLGWTHRYLWDACRADLVRENQSSSKLVLGV